MGMMEMNPGKSGIAVPKQRMFLWILIVFLLIWIVQNSGKIPLYDFAEYWAAGRVFLSGGNAYDPVQLLEAERLIGWSDKDPIMMWNPPWVLPIVVPITFLNYWPSRGLWLVVSCAFVWVISDWLWRIYGGNYSRRWISWLVPTFFLPVGLALFLGQISPMILFGLAGFLWALKRSRFFLAGVFTILIAVKPHALFLFWVFLLLWILRQRCWKVLIGGSSAFALSSILAILVNPNIFNDYVNSVFSGTGPRIWETPNWGAAILMFYPDIGDWVRYLPSVIGTVIAIWLWHSWRHSFDWQQKLPIILLLSIITCSFTWMFDWIVLLPVVILLLVRFENNYPKQWWIPFGLAAMQPLLAFSQAITHSNFYTIWFPPALWFLYWRGDVTNKGYR